MENYFSGDALVSNILFQDRSNLQDRSNIQDRSNLREIIRFDDYK